MAKDPKSSNGCELILGLDLGTTSVKAALLKKDTREILKTKSRETDAFVHNSEPNSQKNEQDVDKILTALQFCVSGKITTVLYVKYFEENYT